MKPMLCISCHFNNEYNEHTMEHQATHVSYTPNLNLEQAVAIVRRRSASEMCLPMSPVPVTNNYPAFQPAPYHSAHTSF